jgi:DNA topoisomerase-2
MARSSSEYVVLSHVEHVRLRLDTYLGRTTPEVAKLYVADTTGTTCIRSVTVPDFVPGLYKIFEEVLVNCIDQSKVDDSLTKIKVTIDQTAEKVTVFNDGRGIPVEKHPTMNEFYTPEVIFGVMLSGSNYDNDVERLTGGRNGLGVKLTNIFFTSFELEVLDSERGLKFNQKWSRMKRKGEPKVTRLPESSHAASYVKGTFVPDLSYFGVEELSDSLVALFHKRVIDSAASTPERVGVYFGGKKVGVNSFNDYVSLYIRRTFGDSSVRDRFGTSVEGYTYPSSGPRGRGGT